MTKKITVATVWKNQIITDEINYDELLLKKIAQYNVERREILSRKFFREISSLHSKNVVFTNFVKNKCEQISVISTVCMHGLAKRGNYGTLLSHIFGKIT